MQESLSALPEAEVRERLQQYGVSNLGELVRTALNVAQNAAERSDEATATDIYIHEHYVFWHEPVARRDQAHG